MRLFVSLGERSASNYVYHIFRGVRDIEITGITDERLESIGFRSVAKVEDLSVVGIAEAIPKIPFVYRLWNKIEMLLPEMDALILCDAPAFNLPLLKRAKGKVKKIIYFISPQVWAWKEKRAKLLSELVNHLVVILPFEVDFYRKYSREGFHVHFVGHPLLDLAKPSLDSKKTVQLVGSEKFIALLPGSRWSEVKRHTPYLLKMLQCLRPSSSIVIPTFDAFREYLKENFSDFGAKVFTPSELQDPSYNLMAHAEFTLLASGTAELEASLLFSPHVVYYRVNPLTYILGRLLVKVRHIALTNLILGREVVPELVQRNPEELCRVAIQYMESEDLKKAMLEDFRKLREVLGGEGAIERLRSLFFQLLYET